MNERERAELEAIAQKVAELGVCIALGPQQRLSGIAGQLATRLQALADYKTSEGKP